MLSRSCSRGSMRHSKGPNTVNTNNAITMYKLASARLFFFNRSQASCQYDRDGLTITELRNQLGMPASTLAHHLRGMVEGGLVTQERQGREVRCRPDFKLIEAAWAYFRDECCKGAPSTAIRVAPPARRGVAR